MKNQDKTISVIVPVYNFDDKFNDNLGLLNNELKSNFINYEIVVVDDGSEKKYQPNFEHLCPDISFHSYEGNKGKGHALKYGFGKSSGDLVCFIDADMELHPSDIKNFVHLMDIYSVDIVIGSKRHPYSEVEYPWYRRTLSYIYQQFVRVFLNVKGVRDSQVGLKLFKREVLENTLPKVLVKKYAFDLELLVVASHLGHNKILEAPIKLKYNVNFETKSVKELRKLIKMMWNLLIDSAAIFYRLRIRKYYD